MLDTLFAKWTRLQDDGQFHATAVWHISFADFGPFFNGGRVPPFACAGALSSRRAVVICHAERRPAFMPQSSGCGDGVRWAKEQQERRKKMKDSAASK
jgi:hypothetical protein